MSRLSTRPPATGWKLAILRGLGDGEVTAILEAAVPGISLLPRAVVASIARIKINLLI